MSTIEHETSLLPALVGPPERFRDSFWPGRAFVRHGPRARLEGVADVAALSDVRALAGAHGEDVIVWCGGALARGPLARLHGRRFSPRDALALHDAGATLFFERVDPWVPPLRPLCRQLERELGLCRGSVYCSAFASPAGGASPAHFDPDLNFSVQLEGRKRWRIAPNRHITDPTRGYSVTHTPEEIPDELRDGLRTPLPRAMPSPAESFELRPGSVLFVPRGHWHETETLEDGLALVFVVSGPTWADAVLRSLRAELVADPRWRAMVPGGARTLPTSLREDLRERIRARADGSWPRLGVAEPRFRRRRGAAAALVEDERGPMLRVPQPDQELHLRVEAPLVALVRHLLRLERPATRGSLDPFAARLGDDTVESVLAELVEARVLERLP